MFIFRPIYLLSSDSSCSMFCDSRSGPEHINMSSAKRRLFRMSWSICTPLFSQFNLLNSLSNVDVYSLGEIVFRCFTPLLILICSLSLCIIKYCSCICLSGFLCTTIIFLFLKLCRYCLRVYVVKCLLVIHVRKLEWYAVFDALVYSMDVICRRVLAPKSCLLSWLIFI